MTSFAATPAPMSVRPTWKCMRPIFCVQRRIRSRRRWRASRPGHFRGVCRWWRSCSISFRQTRPSSVKRIFSSWRSFAGWCATLIFRSRSSRRRRCARQMGSRACETSTERDGARAGASVATRFAEAIVRPGRALGRNALSAARSVISTAPPARIDYLEIVNAENLNRSPKLRLIRGSQSPRFWTDSAHR